ncbi:MAG: hypothetical protein COB50_04590 [Thiotrichales bacterium]|nr:MAG: hypothetical protein COB50_04590 [Thiotrichales bacterium]
MTTEEEFDESAFKAVSLYREFISTGQVQAQQDLRVELNSMLYLIQLGDADKREILNDNFKQLLGVLKHFAKIKENRDFTNDLIENKDDHLQVYLEEIQDAKYLEDYFNKQADFFKTDLGLNAEKEYNNYYRQAKLLLAMNTNKDFPLPNAVIKNCRKALCNNAKYQIENTIEDALQTHGWRAEATATGVNIIPKDSTDPVITTTVNDEGRMSFTASEHSPSDAVIDSMAKMLVDLEGSQFSITGNHAESVNKLLTKITELHNKKHNGKQPDFKLMIEGLGDILRNPETDPEVVTSLIKHLQHGRDRKTAEAYIIKTTNSLAVPKIVKQALDEIFPPEKKKEKKQEYLKNIGGLLKKENNKDTDVKKVEQGKMKIRFSSKNDINIICDSNNDIPKRNTIAFEKDKKLDTTLLNIRRAENIQGKVILINKIESKNNANSILKKGLVALGHDHKKLQSFISSFKESDYKNLVTTMGKQSVLGNESENWLNVNSKELDEHIHKTVKEITKAGKIPYISTEDAETILKNSWKNVIKTRDNKNYMTTRKLLSNFIDNKKLVTIDQEVRTNNNRRFSMQH